MSTVKRVLTHNFYHWLFVVGTSFAQDITALVAGIAVLLVAFFIFKEIESNLLKISLGIPLSVIGFSVVVTNLRGLLLALFSHRYSHNRCPFCGSPIKIEGSELKVTCSKCKQEIQKKSDGSF